jgi:tetratricopeptide (TPR) repeat protein
MAENNSSLKSVLENVFHWNVELTSSLLISNGAIVLLPYELDDQDESHTDKQSACVSYIESISKPNKIFFITTNKWALNIIPLIHHYRQIDCIFILSNTEEYLEYDQIYYKIIGFFSDEKQLIDSIHEQIVLERQQYLSFSFYNQHQKSTRDLSKESASFLWLILFKDIIVRMRLENNHEQAKQELIEQLKQLYRNNRTQLKLIEHFNQTYKTTDNEPLRWYTGKPFLHKQINRALRTEDIQMLHIFRYIISDISACLKLEFEFIKEYVDQIILYRGLRVSNEELDKLKKNIGKMISTNGFLSTSRSRTVALIFAGKTTADKQSVLFEIECNLNELQNDSVIFADISRFSEIRDEGEILFDIGATFIMETISYDNDLSVWLLKLKATDEAAKISQFYLERNKQFIENTSVTLTFGILLHIMGQYNQALDYFQSLLDNSKEDKAFIQFSIGIAKFELGKYLEAFECLEYARTTFESRQPPRFLPEIYTHIGYILSRMGNHDKALQVHLNCLTFAEKRVKNDPQYIATCLGRIGNVYFDKCEYDLAMNYYMKSNILLSTCCPSDYVEYGKNLVNIGSVHYSKCDLDQAWTYYEQGFNILEKCLVSDHTQTIAVLNNLGNVRRDQGDYSAALKYFNQCLLVEMHLFPEGHLDIASTLNQIGALLYLQENFDESLEKYFKALEIQIKFNGNTHLDYAMTLYNIGYTYAKVGKELDTAMNYAQQTLQIIEHNQSMTTSTGGKCLLLVGSIHHLQSNDDQALDFVLNALRILKDVYGSQQHPDIALCLTELGDIYLSKNMFSSALQSHKDALTIHEHFVPTDTPIDKKFSSSRHKDVADSLINIANVYFHMNEIEPALNFCQKSLTIKKAYYHPVDYDKLIVEMKSVAQALSRLEKWDDALTCYLQIDTMVASDEEKTLNLSNIGQCYRAKKNYFIALEYYRQALAIVSTVDISNSSATIASTTIKQDINEMICECAIKVFIEHGHHFRV